jgi:4-amino-4-deoxychorismate lyase
VLGRGLVDPEAPVVRVDDLGVVRGDGVFETVLVRPGRRPWLLEEHLDRLQRSAALAELALPAREDWHGLVDDVVGAWPAGEEATLRLVCTRGVDGGTPTAWALLAPVTAETLRQRRDGVAVVTLSLGVPADARRDAPWLLPGAKTTSYATNMAALRHAAARGADDVIFVSCDGEVLEAPTATVVWVAGGVVCTPPAEELGILAGTTAAELLRRADLPTDVRRARVADLHGADGVWLASAVRGLVTVAAIDGTPRADGGLTGRLRAALEPRNPNLVADIPGGT